MCLTELSACSNTCLGFLQNPTLSDLIGGICSVTLGAHAWVAAISWSSALDSIESTADKRLCVVRYRSACSLPKTEACPTFGVTISQPESGEILNTAARAGDEEARARGTQKSILERKAPPTFPLVIEMRERACWVTHWVEDSVDCLLHGKDPVVQVR